MKIIAAFFWDGSKDKSISYMIIDESYRVRCSAVMMKLRSDDIKTFKCDANEMIQKFFKEIKDIQNGNKSEVSIEYKIVGHANPTSQFHTKMHKPSDRTEYIRKCFLDHFKSAGGNGKLKLAAQYRKKLTKPALTDFKKQINDLQLVDNVKGHAFKCHLWALALHATKTNYPKKLQKLKKALIQNTVAQKDTSKRRAA